MVNVKTLNVGDRVKIVDEWGPGCRQNDEGYMDKYLGSVVTVREVGYNYILIEEDADDQDVLERVGQSGWYWYEETLEPCEPEELTQISEADFLSSLSILGL